MLRMLWPRPFMTMPFRHYLTATLPTFLMGTELHFQYVIKPHCIKKVFLWNWVWHFIDSVGLAQSLLNMANVLWWSAKILFTNTPIHFILANGSVHCLLTWCFPALKLHLEITLKCDSSVVRYFDWKHIPFYCVWYLIMQLCNWNKRTFGKTMHFRYCHYTNHLTQIILNQYENES